MPSSLKLGDVVWARQRGYPWWPAVLSPCPAVEKGVPVKDHNIGQWRIGVGKNVKYHCIFLAWNRERSWLLEKEYKKFKREDGGEGRKKEYIVKSKEFRARHLEAIELAMNILKDPSNPLLYLEKTVINESDPVLAVAEVDDAHSVTENEPVEKKSRKKAKKTIDQSCNRTENNNNVMVEKGISAKPSAGFFKAIAEKVKIPRSRKKVEKFSSDCSDVGKIGKIRKFLQNSTRGQSSEVCPCVGCRLPDCGQCRFCSDMICFGGQGTLKMRCSRKMCVSGKNIDSIKRVDGKAAVGEDVDIVGVLNKGKRANIIDAESEIDSDNSEGPLVINFDANDNLKAVEESSLTREDMPSSSSISYKSCNSRNLISDGAVNVWDQVNSTMMDVEETLANSSVKMGSSLNPIPPQTSPRSPLYSPAGSSNSALTISTPEQSPQRPSVSTKNNDSDDGIFIHADDIDVIIKENIVDKSVDVNENGSKQGFVVKNILNEISDQNPVGDEGKLASSVNNKLTKERRGVEDRKDEIGDHQVNVKESGSKQDFVRKKKLDKISDRNPGGDEVKMASSASNKLTQERRVVEVRKDESEVHQVNARVEESTTTFASKILNNRGDGIEVSAGVNSKKFSKSDSKPKVEKLTHSENTDSVSSKGKGFKVSTEKSKVTEINIFGSLDKYESKRQISNTEKKSVKSTVDKMAEATDTKLMKGGISDKKSFKGQSASEKPRDTQLCEAIGGGQSGLVKSQYKTTKSKSNIKDKIKSRCNKLMDKMSKPNVKSDGEGKIKSKDYHSQKKSAQDHNDANITTKGHNYNKDRTDTKLNPNSAVEEKNKNKT